MAIGCVSTLACVSKVANLLRRNFTHRVDIFLSTPLCKFFYSLGSLKYFCQMCLPQISHKIFYEWSIGHRSNLAQTLPQSLPQSLLRSVDRVFDQFVINVSVKSLNRSSTKTSLRSCQEIFVQNSANVFATFCKKHRHTLIFLKSLKSSISCSRGAAHPQI